MFKVKNNVAPKITREIFVPTKNPYDLYKGEGREGHGAMSRAFGSQKRRGT